MAPSPEEIHEEFRRLATALGRTPDTINIRYQSKFSPRQVRVVCGGIQQAQVGAGLRPTSSRNLDVDDLLREVEVVADELGRMPKRAEFEESSDITAQNIVDRTGLAWDEIAVEIGREPIRHHNLTRAAVVEDLRSIGEKLGRRPEKREAVEHGKHSEWAYTRQFAPYSELVREAGFVVGNPKAYDYDDPAFVAAVEADVRRVRDLLGSTPRLKDMVEHGEYTEWVYSNIHGTWGELKERAFQESAPNQ